ncbi:MAG: hypothetical protein ACLTW9_05520 [Enterocloster sp.]
MSKKSLIERGHKVYLLADHSKFGRVAFMKLTDLEQIDVGGYGSEAL